MKTNIKAVFVVMLLVISSTLFAGCNISDVFGGVEEHTVTFNLMYTESANVDVSVEDGSFVQDLQSTREGYTLLGWYSDSTYNFLFNFATPITGDLNLYAKWQINTYTITLNKGYENLTQTINYTYGDGVTLPTLERSAYTFEGWYLESTFDTLATNSNIINQNINLYAKWAFINYNVVVISENETYGTVSSTYNSETNYVTISATANEGYEFDGWYAGGILWANSAQGYFIASYNMTLVAKFKATPVGDWIYSYSIVDGVNNIDPVSESGGDTILRLFNTGLMDYIELDSNNDITGAYTFETNYSYNDNTITSVGLGGTLYYELNDGTLTLYDRAYQPNETISYAIVLNKYNYSESNYPNNKIILYNNYWDDNGNSIIYTEGYQTINLPSLTREGYVLDGWYYDNNTFEQEFNEDSLLNSELNSDITLYAKWSIDPLFESFGTISLNGSISSYTVNSAVNEVIMPGDSFNYSVSIENNTTSDVYIRIKVLVTDGSTSFDCSLTGLENYTLQDGYYIKDQPLTNDTSIDDLQLQITIPSTIMDLYSYDLTTFTLVVESVQVANNGTNALDATWN